MPEINASLPVCVAFGAVLGLGAALVSARCINGPETQAKQPPAPISTRHPRSESVSSSSSSGSLSLFPSTSPRRTPLQNPPTPTVESAIKGKPLPGKSSLSGAAATEEHELSASLSDAQLVEMKQADLLNHLNSANDRHQPLVVGVAGGTGSGKTTLAKAIRESLHLDCVSYISHDNYYKDLRHLTFEERNEHNFDHPDSLDTDRLFEDVLQLKSGKAVDIPTYDFSTHSRTDVTEHIEARQIILVEGILIFTHEQLRDLMDIRIFVDTADDVRLIRRMTRDMNERGRSTDSVIKQYMKTVRPMHLKFVEPSKQHADVIVPVGLNQAALDMILSRLRFAADV